MMERMTMAKHDKTVQLQALKADTTGFMVTDAQPQLVRLRVGKGCSMLPAKRFLQFGSAAAPMRAAVDGPPETL